MTTTEHRANRVLNGLPDEALQALAASLETVPLRAREVLCEAGGPLEYVYFVHSGIVCLMASLREGMAETATIGSEGCVGFEVVLGAQTATARTRVQLAGRAFRLPVPALRSALQTFPALRDRLMRYVRYMLLHAFQSVACNGLHTVQERCAKWLLIAHDRAGQSDAFHLTQEFMAEMLGVHRPSVTVVARTLQKAGLIHYSRGVITIADRRGLEEAACECYGTLRQALENVLPAQ